MDTRKKSNLIKYLRNHKVNSEELCKEFKINHTELCIMLDDLERGGIHVTQTDSHERHEPLYHINVLPDIGNVYRISEAVRGTIDMRFAASSDWHFASKYHLPKTWHEAMKRTEESGIRKVYVAGDILDGNNIYPGHLENLVTPSVEEQTDLVAEAMAEHPHLEFWGIAGNHDYSFTKQNGVKPLAILEAKADNFKNLGDLRADVIYKGIRIRLIHGGGGRAYSTSYPSQTYLRDLFKGMERNDFKNVPHLIIMGHFHTVFQSKDHGIQILQPGSFQDPENEYCIRRGLTGPNGIYHVSLRVDSGTIDECVTNYVQPRIAEKEKGTQHKLNTRNYGEKHESL